MNFKLLYMCAAISILLPISACKKEAVYPDDIPQWLKDKIEAYHEETRKYKDGCKEDFCIQIFEYKKSDSLVYFINEAWGADAYLVIDTEGIEQCFFDAGTLDDGICGSIGFIYEYELNRVIWQEK